LNDGINGERVVLRLLASIAIALFICEAAHAQSIKKVGPGEHSVGQVRVWIEQSEGEPYRRAIVYSSDMKRDTNDLIVAIGSLMMVTDPSATADERGELLEAIMLTRKPRSWRGYRWLLSLDDKTDALRVIAERER
jgi:hypothetical protein